MGEVLKVFISATSADLGAVRTAAKHALLTLGYFPIEQEHFGPAPETILEMLRRRIGESDAVLHIVGECYGAEPPVGAEPGAGGGAEPGAQRSVVAGAGGERRSYTQWEYHYARELKKPLYVFVCGDAFPYTPHAEESPDARELQRAHRAAVLADSHQYDVVADVAALDTKVREIQLATQRLGTELRRTRRHGRLIGAAIAATLVILVAIGVWNAMRTQTIIDRPPVAPEVVTAYDAPRIRANLIAQIQQRAKDEIAKLDAARDWEKIAELEKTRDQQLADVDRFLEQIAGAFEKKEASANYTTASRLLAGPGGAPEALRFLESKSGARDAKIALLQRAQEMEQQALRELLREKLLAASLLEKDSQWDKAEAEYRAVVRDGGTWPEPRNQLAGLLWQRGDIIEPAEGNRKLREAVELCQGTLAANPRAADPEAWAAAQGNLAAAARDLGNRADGGEGQRLLGQAVTAHRAALEVYTRDQLPQAWAATQNNLGNALWDQGTRAEGAESRRLLGEAVTAFRATLEVYTRAQFPQDWAMTQNNLASALRNQGSRVERAESLRLLGEAVSAYRAALEVRTREQLPQGWAITQNNLGNALQDQGTRAEGAESLRLLGEAVTAYRAALEVRTREQLPQGWAMTQNNLGVALRDQGTRAQGAESLRLLGEAVTAHRAALEVYTREQLPQDWAMTQYNLASTLADQGARAEGTERQRLLGEAVAAGRAALQVYTRAHLPQDWRDTMGNLRIDLRSLAEHAPPEEAAKLRAEAEGIDRELAAVP